ncbi:hypothetical protein [Klebsiella aerogenes]|uniref:hypothetical protein n=1 Tax=Klebsiella aerogenes TaxID=548 RepID=UPI001F29A55F|nr:hypothetical protein [Klebsiella aerogenes]
MEKVITALKELGHCTGMQLARHLGCKPQEVVPDLVFLRDAGIAYDINGIWRWRPSVATKSPEAEAAE